eukprot:gene12723-14932_t
MKLSTLFIVVAIVVALGTITAYNFSLRASYAKGEYKNRFSDMEFTELKSLNEFYVEGANLITVHVEPGIKEGLWIKNKLKEKLKVTAKGQTLILEPSDYAKANGLWSGIDEIILVANDLKKLKTSPYFNEEQVRSHRFPNYGEILLKGFKGNAFELQLGDYTSVSMEKCDVGAFSAWIGGEKNGNASLTINADNQIKTADLNIPGESKVSLINPKITKTSYNLSDKATVLLNGSTLQQIKR